MFGNIPDPETLLFDIFFGDYPSVIYVTGPRDFCIFPLLAVTSTFGRPETATF